MKITSKKLAILALLAVFPTSNAAENPTGNISADSDLVLAGTFPKLDWNINYPIDVSSVVTVSSQGGISAKSDLTMQVRCLAADIQSKRWGGYYTGYIYRYVAVSGYGWKNGVFKKNLFNNTQPYVRPNRIVWRDNLKDGDEITFSAHGNYRGARTYTSGQGSENVLVLKNGDVPPSYTTWSTQSTLGSHIGGYLDENGAVSIGPRDVIVVFELTHVMSADGDNEGDMQDMIFLLTFQDAMG